MANFARGLQLGVSSASEALRTMMLRERENREEEEYRRRKEMEEAIKGAGVPAETRDRQGLQVKGSDGQTFYIPEDNPAAAKAYADAGYQVGDSVMNYQDVNAGSRTVGQYTGNEGAGVAGKYNEGTADRQASVAASYGKPLEAAAYLSLAREPLTRKVLAAQEKSATRGAAKEEEQDLMDKEVSALVLKTHQHDPGTPEHEAIMREIESKVTKAHGALRGQEYATKQLALGEAKRKAEIERRSDAMFDAAAKGPEAAVKSYNKYFKDGMEAKLEKNADGSQSINQYDDGGRKVGTLLTFKDWEKEGRPRLMLSIPEFAKEEYKLSMANKFKMLEIKATGDQHVRYAATLAAGKDKDVKMSETEQERFKVLDKALQDAEGDPKKMEAAYRNMHTFYNSIRMAHGKAPVAWSGGGATAKAPTPMSASDIKVFRDMAMESLGSDPTFRKLDAPSKEAAIDRRTKQMMQEFGGSANVRGLQGGNSGTKAELPSSGGASAVAELAARARSQAPATAPGPVAPRGLGEVIDADPRRRKEFPLRVPEGSYGEGSYDEYGNRID